MHKYLSCHNCIMNIHYPIVYIYINLWIYECTKWKYCSEKTPDISQYSEGGIP